MKITLNKHRIAFSAIALILAITVIMFSFITVAAAVQTVNSGVSADENGDVLYGSAEHEIGSGDLLVTENRNLELDVNIIKAKKITVSDNGSETVVMLARGTVADALDKADIELSENEVVFPSLDSEINGDTEINIYEAKEVAVTADGKTEKTELPLLNVEESLNIAGYKLSKDDILSVSRKENVKNISSVTVSRVTYGEETAKKKIAYKSEYKNSDKVDLGSTKLKTRGVKGEKLVTSKCKYIDGKKVSSKVIKEKITKKPITEVTLVGTRGAATSGGAGTFTDMYGNKVVYSQVLTGSGTAYTAPAGAGTATGVRAYHGGVAVNPNIIPYGSKLYIESTDGSFVYGYATAVDTGGALMAGTAIVDCYYNTYGECVTFGRRNVNVYVIS